MAPIADPPDGKGGTFWAKYKAYIAILLFVCLVVTPIIVYIARWSKSKAKWERFQAVCVMCGARLHIPQDEYGQAKAFAACPEYQGASSVVRFGRRSYVCGGDEKEGCGRRQRGEGDAVVKEADSRNGTRANGIT